MRGEFFLTWAWMPCRLFVGAVLLEDEPCGGQEEKKYTPPGP